MTAVMQPELLLFDLLAGFGDTQFLREPLLLARRRWGMLAVDHVVLPVLCTLWAAVCLFSSGVVTSLAAAPGGSLLRCFVLNSLYLCAEGTN